MFDTTMTLPKSKDDYPKIIESLKSYSQEEQRVIMAEFKKFLKDKEKYIKENNVIYDIL